ncbi:MAG: DUF5333 domain-containing protein [Marinovum sp.]|nr:DUF5333 domain-containing protein [Marinovum sp.]
MIRLSVVLLIVASAAVALPPLSKVDSINDGLRNVKIADEIRSNCPSISARMIAAWSRLDSLKREARGLGYSNAEIDDFVSSKSDRNRLENEAEAYMTSNGVSRGNASSYCALGRSEIQQSSAIGTLLRER